MANEQAVAEKQCEWVEMNAEIAKELVGWRTELEKDEPGIPFVDATGVRKKFVMDKNKSNRPFTPGLAKRYAERFFRGEWSGQWNHPSTTDNGEAWVFDSDGNIVSCAHRAAGLILAQEMRDFLGLCGSEEVEKYEVPEKITVDALLVLGVDPLSADTSDTGKNRSLGDVLFRRNTFANGQEIKESNRVLLNRELAVAVRLVWLRLRGEQVAHGGKFDFPEALSFLETHPLITDCLLAVYEYNGKGKDKFIADYVSLGYAAGMMYLAAFSETDRVLLEEGSLDLTEKPETWEFADDFWKQFALFSAKENKTADAPAVGALHTLLTKNKVSTEKYSRDALCSLIARAFHGHMGDAAYTTSKGLEKHLIVKDGDKNVLDLTRFGGLDVTREVLLENGWIKVVEQPTTRAAYGNWKLGDTVWIDQWTNKPAWFGTIKEFSVNGNNALIVSGEKEDEGQEFSVLIKWFRAEKPTKEFRPPVVKGIGKKKDDAPAAPNAESKAAPAAAPAAPKPPKPNKSKAPGKAALPAKI